MLRDRPFTSAFNIQRSKFDISLPALVSVMTASGSVVGIVVFLRPRTPA
jgi:hypothetical protein